MAAVSAVVQVVLIGASANRKAAAGAEGKAAHRRSLGEEQNELLLADGAIDPEPFKGGAALRAEFPAVAFARAFPDAASLAVVGAKGKFTRVTGKVVVLAADAKRAVAGVGHDNGFRRIVRTDSADTA